ncbi:LuxR C-terminal-related transcriptional regulator [Wenxinia saemankumensis]|uniref:Regulatory protein, luxR family n=1 Tax=Wenxinia saemankumensis TaxID=1447782 RepID=A0A1M6CIE3_9RHOB|nr:LuxR C-terminal-related transcriptional regulator [Wenxinia saemankumensis]SHI60769.1 regulatory protein, luxR family [Wenxinia saemankumensis]
MPEDDAQDLIGRLYDVAVDPARYEDLLDRWEALIAPHRAAANDPRAAIDPPLPRIEDHTRRAAAMLDRALADGGGRDSVRAALDGIDSAAFVVDRGGRVAGLNPPAAQVFGLAAEARLDAMRLAAGEADLLLRQLARMFASPRPSPTVMRVHGPEDGRVVLLNLRHVAPEGEAPFVLVISSELGWSEGIAELLSQAFELTRAECEVVRGLCEGLGAPQIAGQRGRSVGTVRAQIKSILSKTETRGQSELVRLTLSLTELARLPGRAPAPAGRSIGQGTLAPREVFRLDRPGPRQIEYLLLGDPAGRPVLYYPLDYGLVRWPASAEAAAAARGMRIVVPIRPGYGRSTPLPKGAPYADTIVDDHAALLDHLGIAACPVLTLGNDSYFGYRLQSRHPARIAALICASGVLPLTRPDQYERMDKWHRFILASARYTPQLLPFMVKGGFALARRKGKRYFVHSVYGKSAADVATFEIPEVYEAMVCGSDVALSEDHSAHEAFTREVISHERTDWSADLAALRASGRPVVFFSGHQDPQVPLATLEEHVAEYGWIDFRRYPGAGQLLFFREWRDVLDELERHLPPRR